MERNMRGTDIDAAKRTLRKKMKSLRDSLPNKYRKDAAAACRQLFMNSSLYEKANWIYTYISVGSELDTRDLIRDMLADGKHVAVPKVRGKVMDFWEISSLDDCRPGAFGIPEPVIGETSETESCQIFRTGSDASSIGNIEILVSCPAWQSGLILLPGLAFDRRGNRLGYGGGYYDRYLSSPSNLVSAAIVYPEQIIDDVPAGEYDVKVQYLITPGAFDTI